MFGGKEDAGQAVLFYLDRISNNKEHRAEHSAVRASRVPIPIKVVKQLDYCHEQDASIPLRGRQMSMMFSNAKRQPNQNPYAGSDSI